MTGIERLRKIACNYRGLSRKQRYLGINVLREADLLDNIADQIERETQPRRDPAADASVSAYDLLPEEDREAIAWVREHGGIAYVRGAWNVRSNLDRQLEKAQAKVERQQRHIEFVQRKGRERQERVMELRKTVADMRPRLMPEGYEWPTVDGKPVDFVTGYEPSLGVLEAVSIYSNGACEVMGHDGIIKDVREIHVATPKVLDADGAEIREKRDVWWICEGDERGVHAERLRVETIYPNGLIECSPYNGGTWVSLEPSELYVNKPVPASDGKPLREGETVWDTNGDELVIGAFEDGGHTVTCRYADVGDGIPVHGMWSPSQLTHERPDSWERLEEDADRTARLFDAFDADASADIRNIVRRARALAERERGE